MMLGQEQRRCAAAKHQCTEEEGARSVSVSVIATAPGVTIAVSRSAIPCAVRW